MTVLDELAEVLGRVVAELEHSPQAIDNRLLKEPPGDFPEDAPQIVGPDEVVAF